MSENFYAKREREAVERLNALLSLPMPETEDDVGSSDTFDPWALFPAIYGTYSADFDWCAIDVLREVMNGEKKRRDLAAEMFREMLCVLGLCEYGTSPRDCFPTPGFEMLLPRLLTRWVLFSTLHWGVDPDAARLKGKDHE